MNINLRTFAVALAGFCAFVDFYAPQALLPLLTQVFQISEGEASLTISATTGAVALAAPLVGLFADTLGRKRVIVSAILALTVPTLLAATASNLPELLGWRFLQGLAISGITAVTIAYITEEWAEAGVGSVMSIYVAGNVIGGFVGRFVSGLAAAYLGWRWAFIALGLLNLAGGLAVWRWLPGSRRFVRQKSVLASVHAITAHLRNPRLIAAYAAGFNALFAFVAAFTYVSFYLAAPPFRLGPVALGSIFCVYLVGILVTPVVGHWIDRFGYRLAFAVAALSGCLGILLTLGASLWLVLVGLTLFATGMFVCQSAATSYVGSAAGYARSSAAGLYLAFYYTGGSAGAMVPGLFWQLGGWQTCVALIVTVQLLTAGLVLRFWQKQRPS